MPTNNDRTMRRTLTTAYGGVIVFTLISIVVPVVWELLTRKRDQAK